MASVEAAINLVVRGQQRVNSLLQDINQLGAAVENLSRQPLQFDVSAPERQLTQITNAVNNANQRLGTVAQQTARRLASGVNRSYSIFARNQNTINRLEARGATGTRAYSTAVARRDRALEAVAASQEQYNRTLQRTNEEIENNNQMLEENTRNLNQQSRNLRIIDDLSRSWLDASVAVRRYNNELEGVPSSLSAGQIRNEISLFNDLASSVRVGSEAFSQFTIASRSAGQELGNVARRRIGILAEAFSASPQARISPRGEGRSIIPGRELTRTRGEVDRLIETSRSVVPSEAGLTLMIDQLQELRALIPFVDENYGRLTTRIRELNDELNAGTGRPDPVQRQITAEIGRQADLLDRVNRANLTIAQQEVVRGRLEEAGFAVQEGNVELARQQIRGISGQITAMQSVNRQQETRNRLIEDELSLTAGRRRRIVLSDLPQEQKRSLLDRANAAQELLVSGDLEGGKRIRKELDRDRFQSERNYRSTLSLAEARQAIIDKTFSLEQDLTRVQSSGVEIAGELNKLVGIRNILQGDGVNINRQLISDQSILVDGVADFVTTEGKRIANLNRANALTDKQAKAEKDLITKGNILKGIQGKYNDLKAKGLFFGKEEADLQSLISQIDNDQYTANERNIKSLDTLIKKYASFAALKQRDLGKTKNFGTLGIDFIPITGKLPGGRVVPGSPATRRPSRGASFAMGPMAAPVDRITGPVSSIEEPKNMAGLARSAQLQLQQFRALQLSGLDVSREIAGVEKIINDIQGERIPLSERYRKSVEDTLAAGMNYVRILKGQLSINETITNTESDFINKRNDLNRILLKYNDLKKDGVQFGSEEVELQNLVNTLANDNIAKTTQLTTELGRQVRKFQSFQGLRVQEAVAAGAFTGSSTTPEKLESQRNKLLREAFGLRGSLNTLDKKGLDTTAEREQLERQITYLKGKQGQITKDTLRQTQGDLESVRVIFDSLKTGIGELKSELVEASKATGFGKSFQDFQEGLKGSRTFFGDESPAQAIDKIVREFNKGDLTTATRDGEGAAAAAENVVDAYASKIRAGIPAAAKAMMDLGKAGIVALKKALRMASPSRVMLEIAINQVDTYVDYLRAAIPQVEAVARAMGEAGTPPSTAEIPSGAVQKIRPGSSLVPNIAKGVADVIGSSASQSTKGLIAAGLEGLVEKKGQFVDIERAFGKQFESNIQSQLLTGLTDTSEMKQLQQFYADFYNIPEELTPGLKRASASAQVAEQEAVQLNAAVVELASGLENITRLIQSAATLPTSSSALQDPWGNIAPGSQEASRRYMGQVSFAAQGSTGSDLWESLAQAAADANAAAAAIFQAIQDPIADAAPEGERQVRNAIQRLFDKISSILSGLGSGGGAGLPPRPPVGPGGPAGPGGGDGPDSFGARLGAAEAEGVEALLSLQELKKPSKATTKQLEILSAVLKDFYVNLDPTAENAKKLNAELRKTTARLDEIVASRAPDADPLVRLTGSPRLAQGISEGLIGGAFPLLFGQGVGAAAGGGLGGFAGGFMGGSLGFGLSLVGTALGAAIDELGNKAIETGKSLRNPIEGFEQLKEANLFASKSQELYIQKLIESNNVTAASSAIQDEIIKKIGVSGYNNLIRVSQASSNLNKAWADLNVQMQALLAGPLTGFLNWMTEIAKRTGEEVRTGTKIKDVREGLSEADRREFDKQINEAYNKTLMSGGFLKSGSNSNLLKQYGEIADRFESRSNLGAVQATELAPEQINQQQLKPYQDAVDILGKRLESMDLLKNYANQLRDAAREQQDLDQQRFDLLKDYERSIADIRLSVERQVQQEILANKQKENELFAAQGELRLQQLRNTNAELRSSQFGNEFGEQLADIVAQFTEKQLSTENEIANRRKNLELELETKRIQTEQYRIDVAKQVSQLNLSTQKQIEQIQLSVLRKNQDYDRAKFNTEKTIAVTNLEIKRLEAQQAAAMLRSQLGTVQDPIQRISLEQQAAQQTELANFVQRQKDLIKSVQPPTPISFQSASVGSSVSTAGIESAAARGRELITQIESLRTQIDALVQSGDITNINDSFMRLSDQGVKSLIDRYEDLNSLFSGDAGTKTAIDRIQKAFNDIMASETVQKSPIKEDLIGLLSLYRMLSVKNRQLAESLEFVTSKFENQLQEIDGLKGEVNSSIAGLKEYEQTLLDLTLRGLSPASDEFKKFIKNAQEIDRLNQKIEVINGFKTAATELTLSLRGLVEQFFEVGSAAEAVKAFSQEFSKKALGFVLDIGFKPVEQAMQKTMLDLASKLGFDIAPESMKQLQEISTIRTSVQSIEAQIATFIKTLTTANVETLYQQKDSIFFRVGEGEKTSVLSASKSDLAISGQAELDPFIKEAIRRKAITESQAPYARKKLTEEIRKAVPTFGQMDSQAPSSQTGGLMESQIMRDQYGNPVGRGQGGSDDQMPRQAFPLPENHPYPNQDPDSNLPLPGRETLENVIKLQTVPADNIKTLTNDIKAIDGSASEAMDSLRQWDFELNSSSATVKGTAADLVKQNKQLDTVVPQWGKNLGAAVTGLSLASTAVIGIVGGVQNIKAGGAGNVLSGIGSILTTIGSIGMSVSGFMKPAAGNSMLGVKTGFLANANGNVFDDGQLMRFANGGVLQSPTLFNFEDAGVTKTGQAGEAGVEAVMPLKRTKDGRLGVEAELSIPFEADDDQGDTEERDGRTAASALPVPFVRAGGRTGSMTAAQMLQAAAEAGLNVPFMKGSEGGESDLSSLDSPIRFETFRVGELDVVTRKEAEEIGRRAEARGATKGAALAQKRFQNSPGTRRSSGF